MYIKFQNLKTHIEFNFNLDFIKFSKFTTNAYILFLNYLQNNLWFALCYYNIPN